MEAQELGVVKHAPALLALNLAIIKLQICGENCIKVCIFFSRKFGLFRSLKGLLQTICVCQTMIYVAQTILGAQTIYAAQTIYVAQTIFEDQTIFVAQNIYECQTMYVS